MEFGLPDVDARKAGVVVVAFFPAKRPGSFMKFQGMVQLYYDKYIAKPLRLPTVRLGILINLKSQWLGSCLGCCMAPLLQGKYSCGMDTTHTIILFQEPSTFRFQRFFL